MKTQKTRVIKGCEAYRKLLANNIELYTKQISLLRHGEKKSLTMERFLLIKSVN